MSDEELLDDVEMLDGEVDNAKSVTSGLVICTTLMLVVGLFLMMKALGTVFAVGPFKG